MKRFLMLGQVVFMASAAFAAVTTHLKLDCRTGVRVTSADGEVLQYDASWYENGDEVRITDDETVIAEGIVGSHVWIPESDSSAPHTLKLEVLSEGEVIGTETAQFALGYVRNVTARQLWPHKKIEVCYTLADDIGEIAGQGDEVVLSSSAGHFASTVIGDRRCTPGRHCVVWDLEADGIVSDLSELSFDVSVMNVTPGFVTMTFSSSSLTFDKTSDVWSQEAEQVVRPDGLYVTSLDAHTTVAYGCYMWMVGGVTYSFKGCYDDYVGVKVGSDWIMSNSTECNEASGSYTPSSSGYYPVEFRAGNNSGGGGCQNSSEYGIKWCTSENGTWRDVENTDSETVFFVNMDSDAFSQWTGSSPAISVNISSLVKDGMEAGETTILDYSPIGGESVSLAINGEAVCTATEDGTFDWSPSRPGTYVLTHRAGESSFTRRVVVQGGDDARELVIAWLDEPVSKVFPDIYSSVTNIVIAPTVTQIPEKAFAGCSSLMSVTLPEGVTRIGSGAFDGCTALRSIDFPPALVDFGLDVLPEGLRDSLGLSYDGDGFLILNGWLLDYADKEASTLVVPEGVVGIGRSALAEMYDLETVELPSTLKYIGEKAFRLDTYLDNVTIPDSVKTVGESAFEMCTWIQTLTLGSGLETVGDRAFAVCSSLYRVQFSEGLASIGTEAFADCESVMSVSLPVSLTNVASSAFTGCKNLTGVTTPTGRAPLSEWFAPVYTQIREVTVPAGETSVCSGMFKDCSALVSVVLPEGVTNVAAGAFWNCTRLPSVVLPSSLETVGERAFCNCDALTSMGLPESVRDLGAYAFYDCGSLADVSLARELRALPAYVFENCSRLDSLVVPAAVTNLGTRFCGSSVRSIYYLGSAPSFADDAYASTSSSLINYVKSGTKGWDGIAASRHLPDSWPVNNSYSRTVKTWSPVQFDVTFDAGEGLFFPVVTNRYACEQVKGTAYSLPPFNPTRKGYKFAGWWTESSAGTQVTPSTGVKLDRAHTLYAHWAESHLVTVRFNACGGTVSPEEVEYTAEAPFGSFPVPTREHYVFAGWYTAASGGTRMREATEVPGAGRELFAQWTPATYFIRLNANNGSGDFITQRFTYGQTVTLRANPFSCAGCQFAGWSLTPGGVAVYADGKTIPAYAAIEDGVVNLYAAWTGNVYAVRFDSHGGYGVMTNQTFVIGVPQPLSPCTFTRQGFVFKGWAKSTTAAVSFGDGQTVCDLTTQHAGAVVLYAVWERDTTREWTVEECLNCTNLTFELGGDAPYWYGMTTSRADKPGMMRSGAIGDSRTNWIEAVVSGPGTVGFWWKASGEFETSKKGIVTMYDYAEFTVDGVPVAEIGAESDWEAVEETVEGAGPHVLRWQYLKDESGSEGEDCAWVSEIVWTPSPEEVLPDLGSDPAAAQIEAALKDASDAKLAAKITNGTEYVAFRAWAGKVKPRGGSDPVGAEGVMAAPHAWLSYALGCETLIETAPTDGDLTVEAFEPKDEKGKFDFTVGIRDVEVGSEAAEENLKQVFGLEGGTSLEPDEMSAENVDITFGTPADGKVRFTAGPKDTDAETFFMKVRIK